MKGKDRNTEKIKQTPSAAWREIGQDTVVPSKEQLQPSPKERRAVKSFMDWQRASAKSAIVLGQPL